MKGNLWNSNFLVHISRLYCVVQWWFIRLLSMKFNLCSFSDCGLLAPLYTTSFHLSSPIDIKSNFHFSPWAHRLHLVVAVVFFPFDFSNIHFSNSSSSCLDQLRLSLSHHQIIMYQGPIQMLDTSYMKWMRRASHVSHSTQHHSGGPAGQARLNNRSWRLLEKQKLLRFSIKVFPVTEYRIAIHTWSFLWLHKKHECFLTRFHSIHIHLMSTVSSPSFFFSSRSLGWQMTTLEIQFLFVSSMSTWSCSGDFRFSERILRFNGLISFDLRLSFCILENFRDKSAFEMILNSSIDICWHLKLCHSLYLTLSTELPCQFLMSFHTSHRARKNSCHVGSHFMSSSGGRTTLTSQKLCSHRQCWHSLEKKIQIHTTDELTSFLAAAATTRRRSQQF